MQGDWFKQRVRMEGLRLRLHLQIHFLLHHPVRIRPPPSRKAHLHLQGGLHPWEHNCLPRFRIHHWFPLLKAMPQHHLYPPSCRLRPLSPPSVNQRMSPLQEKLSKKDPIRLRLPSFQPKPDNPGRPNQAMTQIQLPIPTFAHLALPLLVDRRRHSPVLAPPSKAQQSTPCH